MELLPSLSSTQIEPPPARGRQQRARRNSLSAAAPAAPLRPLPPYADAVRKAVDLDAGSGVFKVILAHKGSSGVLEEALFTLAILCNVGTPIEDITEPSLRVQIVPVMRQHALRAGVQKARGRRLIEI